MQTTTGQSVHGVYTDTLPPIPVAPAFMSGIVIGVACAGAIWSTHARHKKQQGQRGQQIKHKHGLNLDISDPVDTETPEPPLQPQSRLSAGASAPMPELESQAQGLASAQGAVGLAAETSQAKPPLKSLMAADRPFEERKQALWHQTRLQAPWLLQLLERTPILIWGPQQSGKSSLSKIIAVARKLFLGHKIEVADPQASRNIWPGCFRVYGHDRNFHDVGLRLQAYYQRIARQQPVPTTSLWDEFTSYGEWVPEGFTDYANGFLKSVLAESQAGNEFPILLSHGRTSGYLGGSKGTKESRDKGLVEIEAIPAHTETGRTYASGTYKLDALEPMETGQKSVVVELPPWLRFEALIQMFPELETMEQVYEEPDLDNDQAYQRFISEASDAEIDELIRRQRQNDNQHLPEELATILDYSMEHDWIKPSDISGNRQGFRKVPSVVIQAYFRELVGLGLGEVLEEGNTLKFRAFKTDSGGDKTD